MDQTITDDDTFEPHHASSQTDRVIRELQLYGHRPFADEPDPRPLPDEHSLRAALGAVFEILAGSFADTRLEPDLDDVLWGVVNLFHRGPTVCSVSSTAMRMRSASARKSRMARR